MAIRYQPRQEIYDEVIRASVTRVLYLRDVFELAVDGLYDETLSQQQLVPNRHQPVFHVLSDRGY